MPCPINSSCPTNFSAKPPDLPFAHAVFSPLPSRGPHQDGVVDAIAHILTMPPPAFDAYCLNAGFGKTIRNYQYIVSGPRGAMSPYKTKWGPVYFRMTIEAQTVLSSVSKGPIHYEHAVPAAVVQRRLIELREIHPTGIPRKEIQDAVSASEIIIVTKFQQLRLDRGKDRNVTDPTNPTVSAAALGLAERMTPKWKWGGCHLARVCQVTQRIVGTRMIL